MSAGYLAVDLGAESGRVVLGRFDGGRVSLEEVHRFPNTAVKLPDGLHWDVLRILSEIKEGLAKAVREGHVEGVGVDSWGVDFGLLDAEGALVSNPYHHRDSRTEGMIEAAFGLVPGEEIYGTTGIQFLPINTLYQLLAMRALRCSKRPKPCSLSLTSSTTGLPARGLPSTRTPRPPSSSISKRADGRGNFWRS